MPQVTGRKEQVERRTRLADRTKQRMMAILLRSKRAFETVHSVLRPEHFGVEDQIFTALLAITRNYHEQYAKLPPRTILLEELATLCRDYPEALIEHEREDAKRFLSWAFKLQKSELDADWAITVTKRFLDEHVANKLGAVFNDADSQVPASITRVLQDLQEQAEQFQSLDAGQIEVPFPEGWNLSQEKLMPTNISFLDSFLGGGCAGQEVYGLLGPFASCKTLLGVQICSEGAREQARMLAEGKTGGKRGIWMHFSYEAPLDPELRVRFVSYLGKIKKDRIEHCTDWRTLSTSENLQPYELRMYRDKLHVGATKCLGEQARKRNAEKLVNAHIRIMDMTGSDRQHPNRGGGYVGEIVALIGAVLRQEKNAYIAGVVVDYAGLMVERYLSSQPGAKMDIQQYRHALTKLPLHLRNKVAMPHRCPVWLLHQLSGEANKLPPGVLPHHTNSAESKSFAENLSFSFSVGNKDQNDRCLFGATKTRRAKSRKPEVIRINGAFSRVDSNNELYVLDPATNRIVAKKELDSIGGGVYAAATKLDTRG